MSRIPGKSYSFILLLGLQAGPVDSAHGSDGCECAGPDEALETYDATADPGCRGRCRSLRWCRAATDITICAGFPRRLLVHSRIPESRVRTRSPLAFLLAAAALESKWVKRLPEQHNLSENTSWYFCFDCAIYT